MCDTAFLPQSRYSWLLEDAQRHISSIQCRYSTGLGLLVTFVTIAQSVRLALPGCPAGSNQSKQGELLRRCLIIFLCSGAEFTLHGKTLGLSKRRRYRMLEIIYDRLP